MDTVSERMKHAFTICGLSQVQVARDLQIGQSTISKWLNGVLEPRLVHILALKDLYGVNPAYIKSGSMPVVHENSDKNPTGSEQDSLIQKLMEVCKKLPDDKLLEIITFAERIARS